VNNEDLQTIDLTHAGGVPTASEIREVLERVRTSRHMVRIITRSPQVVGVLREALEASPSLTFAVHPVGGRGSVQSALIIRPKVRVIDVGYGNEIIKVAPAFEASGYGRPAVAIFSLNRPERVIHAFEMGYDVYVTDKFDQQGTDVYAEDPGQLQDLEAGLRDLLVDAFTAKWRNELLRNVPASGRAASERTVLARAETEGRREAERRFSQQFRGLLSSALLAGEFDLVIDGTPDGSGADNKRRLYEPAAARHPGMKFVYQGGEKASIGEASFSAVAADFDEMTDAHGVRHVSCNTTALSTLGETVGRVLGVPLIIDNTAVRRAADPGDLKGGVTSIQYAAGYHHGPDFLSVFSPEDQARIAGVNTDAALSGSLTRFHVHVLSMRRADGQRLDRRAVQRALAVHSRIALVEFPNGSFNSTLLNELAHNLLPQWASWTPEGANHPLVPITTVWETDDPSELRVLYAVPQESIVAPGNVNLADALFGQAGKDASLAVVNDATGIPQLVAGIETRLPVRGLEQQQVPPIGGGVTVDRLQAWIVGAQQGENVDRRLMQAAEHDNPRLFWAQVDEAGADRDTVQRILDGTYSGGPGAAPAHPADATVQAAQSKPDQARIGVVSADGRIAIAVIEEPKMGEDGRMSYPNPAFAMFAAMEAAAGVMAKGGKLPPALGGRGNLRQEAGLLVIDPEGQPLDLDISRAIVSVRKAEESK
jgi:glyceraldehyde-3-phosphate dehydrogenase type II